jgi:aminopeptidase N
VRIAGPRVEVAAARGLPKPLLVFPNYSDHAWAKVALDGESLAFVRDRLEDVDDDLLRQMLWSSLYTMVRDQLMKSTDYLSLVRAKLPMEPNLSLVDSVLNQAAVTLSRFVPDGLRDAEANAMFETARAALSKAGAGDAQIIWVRNLIGFATVPENVRACARLADGEETVEGLTIDQDMRWSIAARFMAYGMPGATERVATEAQRDPTDRGQRARIQAEVSAPDAAVKATAWEKILGEGYGSLHLTEAAMGGFNWWKQRDILARYVDRFFGVVTSVFQERDNEFARGFHRSLFPGYIVEEDTARRAQRVVDAAGVELPTLVRSMRESIDELERAIRCRALVRG